MAHWNIVHQIKTYIKHLHFGFLFLFALKRYAAHWQCVLRIEKFYATTFYCINSCTRAQKKVLTEWIENNEMKQNYMRIATKKTHRKRRQRVREFEVRVCSLGMCINYVYTLMLPGVLSELVLGNINTTTTTKTADEKKNWALELVENAFSLVFYI